MPLTFWWVTCQCLLATADSLYGSSDRKHLSAHAEILALQERLGLSYKDAAHRLYIAELERVKRDRMMFKAFSNFEKSTKKTLEMALKSLGNIEGTQGK